jgi:hypothetical protein
MPFSGLLLEVASPLSMTCSSHLPYITHPFPTLAHFFPEYGGSNMNTYIKINLTSFDVWPSHSHSSIPYPTFIPYYDLYNTGWTVELRCVGHIIHSTISGSVQSVSQSQLGSGVPQLSSRHITLSVDTHRAVAFAFPFGTQQQCSFLLAGPCDEYCTSGWLTVISELLGRSHNIPHTSVCFS